MDVERLISE